MSFEENFLYPFYLILVGGLISGVLIPTYNWMKENRQRKIETEREDRQKKIEMEREDRQKKIEMEREDRQRVIDRNREDHRYELDIKRDLVEEISKSTAEFMMNFIIDIGKKHKKEIVPYKDWRIKARVIGDLLNLYFSHNTKIVKDWNSIYDSAKYLSLGAIYPDEKKDYIRHIEYALNRKLPEDFSFRDAANVGNLLSYGINGIMHELLKEIENTRIKSPQK